MIAAVVSPLSDADTILREGWQPNESGDKGRQTNKSQTHMFQLGHRTWLAAQDNTLSVRTIETTEVSVWNSGAYVTAR